MGGTSAVIPAAGRGERLGHSSPKAFVLLDGTPLLAWSLAAMESSPVITEIVIVTPATEMEATWQMAVEYGFRKVRRVVAGADDRQSSVLNGVVATDPGSDVILVHDAARPLVPPDVIAQCADAARKWGAATAAVPVADTLRRGAIGGSVNELIDRSGLVRIQTPQAVRADIIRSCMDTCRKIAPDCTDDTSMVERAAGVRAHVSPGSELSFKVTTPEDLTLAEALVRNGAGVRPGRAKEVVPARTQPFAIGLGYDVHAFDPERPMWLLGVHIPDTPGLSGHSDADVALHAVCDAILGAIGERDIGYHFPNTDPAYAGARSTALLARVVELATQKQWAPVSIDVTVIAERPKLEPYVREMRRRLAELTGVSEGCVAIKATTNEKMGFIGRGEGIACFALAVLAPAHQGEL